MTTKIDIEKENTILAINLAKADMLKITSQIMPIDSQMAMQANRLFYDLDDSLKKMRGA